MRPGRGAPRPRPLLPCTTLCSHPLAAARRCQGAHPLCAKSPPHRPRRRSRRPPGPPPPPTPDTGARAERAHPSCVMPDQRCWRSVRGRGAGPGSGAARRRVRQRRRRRTSRRRVGAWCVQAASRSTFSFQQPPKPRSSSRDQGASVVRDGEACARLLGQPTGRWRPYPRPAAAGAAERGGRGAAGGRAARARAPALRRWPPHADPAPPTHPPPRQCQRRGKPQQQEAPAGTAAAGAAGGRGAHHGGGGGPLRGVLEWASRIAYTAVGLYLGVVTGVLWALAHAPLDYLNGAPRRLPRAPGGG
jgi:hypothetical protein